MREGWFGDRYDHLKWSILLELAEQNQTIFYVAMLRETIESERIRKSCNPKVVSFFKSLQAPKNKPQLQKILELDSRIQLFDKALPDSGKQREEYFCELHHALKDSQRASFCLFLDPDTGLSEKPSGEHLSYKELKGIWGAMKPGDRIVVYQHGWRPKGGNWHSIANTNMAEALNVPREAIIQKPDQKTNVSFLTTVKD